MTIRVCDSFEDAFSLCREANKPMTVYVRDELGRVFPSGRFESMSGRTVSKQADDVAQARIATLEAENRRLREALERVLNETGSGGPESDYVSAATVSVLRAAMEAKPQEVING